MAKTKKTALLSTQTFSEITINSSFHFSSAFFSLSFCMLLASPVFLVFKASDLQLILLVILNVLVFTLESIHDSYIFSDQKALNAMPRKIRVLILLLGTNWVLSSFIYSFSFPLNILFNPFNTSSTISLLLASAMTHRLRAILVDRMKIHEIISAAQSMNDTEIYVAYADELLASWKETKNIKTWSMTLFFIALIMASVSFFSAVFVWYFGLWFICALISSLLLISVANSFMEESRYYEHGLSSPLIIQANRQNSSIFIIFLSVSIGFLCANSWSVFGPDVVSSFITWFFGLFVPRGQLVDTSVKVEQYVDNIYQGRSLDLLKANLGPTVDINPFWSYFFMAFQYIAVAAVLFLALKYVLKPFVKRDGNLKEYLKLLLTQIFSLLFKPLLSLGALIWGTFFDRNRRRDKKTLDQKTGIKPWDYILNLSSGTSVETATYLNLHKRSLKIYLRFLEWAFKLGMRWEVSHTPREIADKTIAFLGKRKEAFPNLELEAFAGSVFELSDLLEEDLYSPSPIKKEKLVRMEELVALILEEKAGD